MTAPKVERHPVGEDGTVKVLVTGATGFVGAHLCAALVDAGHHVGHDPSA